MEQTIEDKLKEQLRKIFRTEQKYLDFGIYRIMNHKAEQIERFIEQELINKIQRGFDQLTNLQPEQKQELQKQFYNKLLDFFSRYYHQGDFIAQPRFSSKAKYLIPYNGQETYLYWVTKEQYFVKSSQWFKFYSFNVRAGELRVNFKLDQVQQEKGNVKAAEKKYFVLSSKQVEYKPQEGELNIFFDFRPLSDQEAKHVGKQNIQERLNQQALEKIKQQLQNLFNPSEAEQILALLEPHLKKYTHRNSSDFFIHKDLKTFLTTQLELFINSEFLQQALNNSETANLQDTILLANLFWQVASSIINLLAQLENLQKRLWEKPKFVLQTHYVITLGRLKQYVSPEFFGEIIQEIRDNARQLSEWQRILGIEPNQLDLSADTPQTLNLPVDTRHFSEEFKWKLLNNLKADLEKILDGVLVHSDNFQALKLLTPKFKETVKTIYIDPPFNKEQEAEYLYKVGYKDATWLTMLENRLTLAKELMAPEGSIFVRCDYNGNMYVRLLMNQIFGPQNFRNEIIVKRGAPKAGLLTQFDGIKSMAVAYDNLYWYSKNPEVRFKGFYKPAPKEKQQKGFWADFQKGEFYDRPTMRYPILGITIEKGQWKWSKQRAYKAVENYEKYLAEAQHTGESLEQYWFRTGQKLEFIKREGNKIKYWVHPREFLPLDNNWLDISGYSSTTGFQTENSEVLLKRVIEHTTAPGDWVMDFFLGSGTTIAVAQKLKRRWIGIEMGNHFWTVVLPRLKRILYYDPSGISKEIKQIYSPESAGGFFKYHTIEQYEDSLENVSFRPMPKQTKSEFYRNPHYMIEYMLSWETEDSPSFFNISQLRSPFDFKLKIYQDYRLTLQAVDMVETFNYLKGITVSSLRKTQHQGRDYVFVFGKLRNRPIAVVWRDIQDLDFDADREFVLSQVKWFNPKEIYLNAEASLPQFKLIEAELKSLMNR